jgi:nuclear GTP-binding protein
MVGKRDFGIPKFQGLKTAAKQAMPMGTKRPQSAAALSALAGTGDEELEAGPSSISFAPVDAALTTRDSSSKAFLRELRKVIDRSDVIIQVLDARDPDGTRSRWVEEEVGKRMGDGKKLLAVVNKIGRSLVYIAANG